MEKIEDTIPVYTAGTAGHLIVCLHGAGHSSMSFAALAERLKSKNTIVGFDFRGHGQHFSDNETDLSQQSLIDETLKVLNFIEQKHKNRSIILLGHSMGGSIATKVAYKIETEMKDSVLKRAVLALFVIDVVEGTAMEALPFMEQIVHNRPAEFRDLVSVIKYGISSGQVRDKRSARVSMPSQVKEVEDKKSGGVKYVWRTELMATKPFWVEWFSGLTQNFLDVAMKKQLILAGSERMDKELTIAQMQGKFSMKVIHDCGHVVQEDQPAQVATAIQEFIDTFKFPVDYTQQHFIINAQGKKIFIGR